MADFDTELSVGDFYERVKQIFVENDTSQNGALSTMAYAALAWLLRGHRGRHHSDRCLPFL